MEKTELILGLVEGRHPLPVESYVFGEIQNVLDFDALNKGVEEKLANVNGDKERLTVYVTGLTAATASIISYCASKGIELTLMHFDRESGNYLPQVVVSEGAALRQRIAPVVCDDYCFMTGEQYLPVEYRGL